MHIGVLIYNFNSHHTMHTLSCIMVFIGIDLIEWWFLGMSVKAFLFAMCDVVQSIWLSQHVHTDPTARITNSNNAALGVYGSVMHTQLKTFAVKP